MTDRKHQPCSHNGSVASNNRLLEGHSSLSDAPPPLSSPWIWKGRDGQEMKSRGWHKEVREATFGMLAQVSGDDSINRRKCQQYSCLSHSVSCCRDNESVLLSLHPWQCTSGVCHQSSLQLLHLTKRHRSWIPVMWQHSSCFLPLWLFYYILTSGQLCWREIYNSVHTPAALSF